LAQKGKIPIAPLDELAGLSDLFRVYEFGAVFARIIFDLGIQSIRDFIQYPAEDIIEIYETQTLKKAYFGIGEIEFSLVLARELEIA
jgi:hypothetical protein